MTHFLLSSGSLLLPSNFPTSSRGSGSRVTLVTDIALEGHFKMCPPKSLNGWPIGSLWVSSVLPTGEGRYTQNFVSFWYWHEASQLACS